jgi:hypothetical protein
VRALCGLSQGSTRLLSPVNMLNLLGDMWGRQPARQGVCEALILIVKGSSPSRPTIFPFSVHFAAWFKGGPSPRQILPSCMPAGQLSDMVRESHRNPLLCR